MLRFFSIAPIILIGVVIANIDNLTWIWIFSVIDDMQVWSIYCQRISLVFIIWVVIWKLWTLIIKIGIFKRLVEKLWLCYPEHLRYYKVVLSRTSLLPCRHQYKINLLRYRNTFSLTRTSCSEQLNTNLWLSRCKFPSFFARLEFQV